jgi:group I intron endonuclease
MDALALGCIYLITCIVTGDQYVGQTIHPLIEDRFDEHIYAALVRKTRTYLYNAIRKYGPESFKIELLSTVPYDSLDRMEAYWAEQLQTYIWDHPRGYNMVWCGEHGRRGIRHTETAKEKMRKMWADNREKFIALMRTPERRFITGSANRGKHLSPEQCEKLRLACAKWWSSERRAVWSLEVKERMKDDDLRARISQSCSAFWTPEKKEQKSKDMKISVTDADRQRSSDASLAYWSIPENREAQRQARLGVKRPRSPGGTHSVSEQGRLNMSAAAKGKPKTQLFKDAIKLTAAKKFAVLFHAHLTGWIADPKTEKQWRYDMSRKRRDGTLLDEYVQILENTSGWSWS